MKRKYRGSNLVEYMLPAALIGVVMGGALYNSYTNDSILNYVMNSLNMKINEETLVIDNANNNTNKEVIKVDPYANKNISDSSTTPPAMACSTDNTCTIDFGNFKLTGVPSNFTNVVETSGANAGTEQIALLLDQIANILAQNNKISESDQVKDLANMGHALAALEKEIPNYHCSVHYNNRSAQCGLDNTDFLGSMNNFISQKDNFISMLSSVENNISDPLIKQLISQPSNEIILLANKSVDSINTSNVGNHYCLSVLQDTYNNISTTTDLKSVVICAAGKGQDASGHNCK